MSLSYARVIATLPTQVREVNDYLTKEKVSTIPNNSELYLESTDVNEDKEGNLWIFCPIDKMYYELYRKKTNEVLLEIFPTIAAEVTRDCKSGLALYERNDTESEELDRRKSGETYHITSEFYTDERDNVWVKSVNIEDADEGYETTIGWLLYKNHRNNFANLLIHGKYPVLTTDGEIDDEKVEKFREYLKTIRYNWMYDTSPNFLQMFATVSSSSVKTGKSGSKKGTVKSNTIYKGEKSIEKDYGNRKEFPFKKRSHSIKKIQANAKEIVQNKRSFPRSLGKDKGVYHYDYFMDYKKDGLLNDMDAIRRHLNIDIQSYDELFEMLTSRYNRFKLANPNDVLSKGFPHVFFTRPDCNFFNDKSGNLAKKPGKDPNIKYINGHKPALLRQLCQVDGDQWMYLLSNKIVSFSPMDESIGTDTYGTTYHKQKIAFGRSNAESKAAGTFSTEIADTRELDILELHKLWTDYISNVYHGRWNPKHKYIWRKVIDYASSCYYIITAEDGETIIFWSKYYGVFPANVPSSAYSWNAGEPIKQTNLGITYQYSFKEDLNPSALVEFNLNSNIMDNEKLKYEATYNPYLGTTGYTWVGKPFIETCVGAGKNDLFFKLRYKKGGE